MKKQVIGPFRTFFLKFWRINLVLGFFIIFSAAIIGRLVFLQILNHQYWQALAQGQQKIFEQVKGDRGEIFLRDKTGLVPLAINKVEQFCFASPQEIENLQETAEILSEVLGLNKEELLKKLENRDSLFLPLKYELTKQEIESLKNLSLTGVYLKEEKIRYYPKEDLASSVIGFISEDKLGQYGVEGYWQDTLEGEEVVLEGEKGPKGYLFLDNQDYESKKGSDIILTIDYNIQYLAEKLLDKAHQDLNIEGGQIIVIEPNSGKIIALADFPNFNLNKYSAENNLDIFQNGAIQKIFEPGSVFKPITMAAALDQGKVTPQTTFIDDGKVEIGTYTIYNYDNRVWGERTMTEVLDKSINTGAIFAERQLGHNLFLKYIKKFGLLEPTGIGLQGEVFSINSEFQRGYEVNFATASFGQGIEITPIQLTQAFCAIANGGKLVKPYIIEDIISSSGFSQDLIRDEGEQIILKKTSSQLASMLVSGVEDGYSSGAKIPGYHIAGKTGTAQVSFSSLGINKKGYSDKTWQSFIGFAPAFSPQFLILVKLNNPSAKTASYSAAPIFKDLAQFIIDYWQIAPDYDI